MHWALVCKASRSLLPLQQTCLLLRLSSFLTCSGLWICFRSPIPTTYSRHASCQGPVCFSLAPPGLLVLAANQFGTSSLTLLLTHFIWSWSKATPVFCGACPAFTCATVLASLVMDCMYTVKGAMPEINLKKTQMRIKQITYVSEMWVILPNKTTEAGLDDIFMQKQ